MHAITGIISYREILERLAEHDKKFNEIVAKLAEYDGEFNRIDERLTRIETTSERFALTLEEEDRESSLGCSRCSCLLAARCTSGWFKSTS